jgi:hypothetical protein
VLVRENKTVDIECDGKVYEMSSFLLSSQDYVNLYGRDISANRLKKKLKLATKSSRCCLSFPIPWRKQITWRISLELVNRHAVESIHTTFARIALLEDDKFIMRAAYPIRALDHDLGIGDRNPVTSLPYTQRVLEQNEPMILRASDPGSAAKKKKLSFWILPNLSA